MELLYKFAIEAIPSTSGLLGELLILHICRRVKLYINTSIMLNFQFTIMVVRYVKYMRRPVKED